ncbi:MAG: hypothetical protein J2P21_30945 [Chloracidobacterium sp.]|nr:hypothetical protein [Chloracidobacterium sp.]
MAILWRKKLLIIVVATSVAIATSQIIRRIPNIYESHALIAISNQANNDGSPSSPPLATLTERMTSQGYLSEIVRRYDLYNQTPGALYDPEVAVERLRRSVKIDIKMRNYYPDAPESLTISYRYSDPVIAQRVVDDLISIFDHANAAMRRQATTELEQFNNQVAEIQRQLHTLAPQRDLALLRSGEADNSPAAARAQRLAAADSIGALGDKEFMLQQEIIEQKRQIAEQEKLVSSTAPAARLATNNAYGVLLARRAEVEGQIRDLSRSATEKNPKMIQARSQLTAINQEIARLESISAGPGVSLNSASPEASELRAMRRDLQRLETELEVTQRDLNRKAQGLKELSKEPQGAGLAEKSSSAQLSEAKTEYDRLIGRYNYLLDKQESLQRQSGVAGKGGDVFQVIDAPLEQLTPVGPNRFMLKLFALAIALGSGLLVASAHGIPQLFLIQNDRDVEYYLGTRVLAVIPETLPPFQRGRRRLLSGLRWLGLAMLFGAMIPIFIAAFDRIQIFQILANR